MEKAKATHSSTLVWKILRMEEPGRLQSMGLRRVGHDWATSLSRFTFLHWRRKWQPTPVFLPGEPSMGSHSRRRLKWLISSRVEVYFFAYACPDAPISIAEKAMFPPPNRFYASVKHLWAHLCGCNSRLSILFHWLFYSSSNTTVLTTEAI